MRTHEKPQALATHERFAFFNRGGRKSCVCLRKKWKRIAWRYLLPMLCFLMGTVILLLVFAITVSAAVCHSTSSRIVAIDDLEQLVEKEGQFDCILVLGCRVYSDGTPSPMLHDRVFTGVSAYKDNASEQLLMSGDGHLPYYDEVQVMQALAVELGVGEAAIVTDAYGLSTYDSIARYAALGRGKRVLIVTQEYHLYRALYIADKLGLDAYGASADLRPYTSRQVLREAREIFARCKDVLYALQQPPFAT